MTDGPDESATLGGFLQRVASDLPDVEVSVEAGTTTYRTNGTEFAVVRPGEASFRLRADIAKGALATPDTATSPQGAGWVRFTPPTLDTFDLDRAEAWLVIAHRFATQPAGRPGARRPD